MLQLHTRALQLLLQLSVLLLAFGQLALQTQYLLPKAVTGLLKLLGVSNLDGELDWLRDPDRQCNFLRPCTTEQWFIWTAGSQLSHEPQHTSAAVSPLLHHSRGGSSSIENGQQHPVLKQAGKSSKQH